MVLRIPAQRSGRNHLAGSFEAKTYSLSKETYKELKMASVVPRNLEKLQGHHSREVFVQKDSGSQHLILEDPNSFYTCTTGRKKVTLLNQAVNSPDSNVLVVYSKQSFQSRIKASTIDQIIDAAHDAFAWSEYFTPDNDSIMIQYSMEPIMEPKGRNDLKIPHPNKSSGSSSSHQWLSILPCLKEALKKCSNYLDQEGNISTLVYFFSFSSVSIYKIGLYFV